MSQQIYKRAEFFQGNLDSAAALGAMTMHRAVMTSGFTLTQSMRSTDSMILVALGFVAFIWTVLIFLLAYKVGDRSCVEGL